MREQAPADLREQLRADFRVVRRVGDALQERRHLAVLTGQMPEDRRIAAQCLAERLRRARDLRRPLGEICHGAPPADERRN
jgi:hypothetical protein